MLHFAVKSYLFFPFTLILWFCNFLFELNTLNHIIPIN